MISTALDLLTVQTLPAEAMAATEDFWSDVECPSFMQSPRWLANAWAQYHRFQPGVQPNACSGLLVSDGEKRPLGCSFWFRQSGRAVRWWRLVGSGAICSDYAHIPSRREWDQQVGVATANWFGQQPRRSFDFPNAIEVEGHLADSPQWQAFFETLRDQGWTSDSTEIDGAWRLTLPQNWKSFESLLGKTHRRKARRAMQLLQEGVVEHLVCRTPSEINQHWPSFIDLHQKRRKLLGQTGCFADPRFEQFLKTTTLAMAEQDGAWLSLVRHDGTAIAALLIFDWQGTASLYQSGIDTDRLDMEPGHVVNAATIHACIQARRTYFDFLRGDERYKSNWRAERSRLMRTRLYPPGAAGRQLAAAYKLRRSLSNWMKSRSPECHPQYEINSDAS